MKPLIHIQSLGQRLIKDPSGVTAIEYALVGSLIAVVIVAAVTSVGTNVNAMFTAVADSFP